MVIFYKTYLDFNLVECFAVVDTNDAADHFWHDDHVTKMGLDTLQKSQGTIRINFCTTRHLLPCQNLRFELDLSQSGLSFFVNPLKSTSGFSIGGASFLALRRRLISAIGLRFKPRAKRRLARL